MVAASPFHPRGHRLSHWDSPTVPNGNEAELPPGKSHCWVGPGRTFLLLGALLEKPSSIFLKLESMEQKGKPKEFMMAVPAMLALGALRKS